MRPLTDTTPKPLISIAGRPMLARIVDHIAAVGIRHIVINAHWCASVLVAYGEKLRAEYPHIHFTIVTEDTVLETGGGVENALPQLSGDGFFVINGDTFWCDDGPGEQGSLLQTMMAQWAENTGTNTDALLMLVPQASAIGYGGAGDFVMDAHDRLRRRADGEVAPYVFGGVQILRRTLFRHETPAVYSLNLLYDVAMARGTARGWVFDGAWYYITTAQSVQDAQGAYNTRHAP